MVAKVENVISENEKNFRLLIRGDLKIKIYKHIKGSCVILDVSKKYGIVNIKPGMIIQVDGKFRLPHPQIIRADFPEEIYLLTNDAQFFGRAYSKNISCIRLDKDYHYYLHVISGGIKSKIVQIFPKRSLPIMNALLTGDKSLLQFEDKQLFSLTGTAHVLAVSGLHVGLIALIIYAFIGFIPNKWIKFAIFSLIVIAYVILTGSQPSAERAAVMAIVFLFLKNVSRDVRLLNVTSFCGLMMIIISPELIYSAGFQMSVGSVIGIALLYEPINMFFMKILKISSEYVKWLINSLSISLAAGIAVSPFVAYYFGVYSIISPITNIFAVPFTSLALMFGLIGLIFSYFIPGLAIIYAYAASCFIDLTVWLNRLALKIPFSYIEGDDITFIVVLISASLAYILVSKEIKQFWFRLGFGIIIALVLSNSSGNVSSQKTFFLVRDQYYGILYEGSHMNKLLIADRKPDYFRYKDYSLLKQIRKSQKPLQIYSCGLIGANIQKEIKYSTLININYLTLKEAAAKYGLKNIQQEIRIHRK